MKKLSAALVLLSLFAGCLMSEPPQPVAWNLTLSSSMPVSRVLVSAPYDGVRFSVLRSNGSIAFDSYNVFSSRPASLLRASFLYDSKAPVLVVRTLALDCRKKGERDALVELELIEDARCLAQASVRERTGDGNYTRAFSAALSRGVDQLSAQLRK